MGIPSSTGRSMRPAPGSSPFSIMWGVPHSLVICTS